MLLVMSLCKVKASEIYVAFYKTVKIEFFWCDVGVMAFSIIES